MVRSIVSTSFQKVTGPVSRLGLRIWVNASFQNFALTAGGNVLHRVERGDVRGGNCPGAKCPTPDTAIVTMECE